MKIRVPCLPVVLEVSLRHEPRTLRPRLSIRGLLLLVLISAVASWFGVGAYERYCVVRSTRTYPVADLVAQNGGRPDANLAKLSSELRDETAQGWWPVRDAEIRVFPLSLSIIVRDTAVGHQQVKNWLDKRRSARPVGSISQPQLLQSGGDD